MHATQPRNGQNLLIATEPAYKIASPGYDQLRWNGIAKCRSRNFVPETKDQSAR